MISAANQRITQIKIRESTAEGVNLTVTFALFVCCCFFLLLYCPQDKCTALTCSVKQAEPLRGHSHSLTAVTFKYRYTVDEQKE